MAEQIGRYWVCDPLATGGMAVVHLARLVGPLGFARTLAVKRLHKHLAADGELAVMLLDEARITARIQHPCVVQTLDVVSADGELLIVMEYVHGESLARLSKRARERGQPIDPAISAACMIGVLSGLHAAHEAVDEDGTPLGVVHRDVSPQNVLVGLDGTAKVLDFGVAKALGRAQTTREGQLKGKLAYMSPEQLQAGKVDRRTDVFAAAIVFWEALTGARLFAADDEKSVVGNVLNAVIEAPSQRRSDVSPALDAVVLRGLARDPAVRYATAREMALAIEAAIVPATPSKVAAWVEALYSSELSERRRRIASLERSGSSSASAVALPAEQTKSAQSVSVPVPPPRAAARRWPLVVSLAVALLGMVFATSALVRRARSSAENAPPPSHGVRPSSSAGGTAAPSALETNVDAPTGDAAVAAGAASVASSGSSPSVLAPSKWTPPTKPPGKPLAAAIPSASAATAPTIDCTNPYVLNAQGHKRYRRECLQP